VKLVKKNQEHAYLVYQMHSAAVRLLLQPLAQTGECHIHGGEIWSKQGFYSCLTLDLINCIMNQSVENWCAIRLTKMDG